MKTLKLAEVDGKVIEGGEIPDPESNGSADDCSNGTDPGRIFGPPKNQF